MQIVWPGVWRTTSRVSSVASMNVMPGDRVLALNARGERGERIAITGVVQGRDFPVVWICQPEEWDAAQAEKRQPEGVPWPAEDISPLEDAHC
jgi:hypothetical protein